jgi:hypothetical protein
VDAFGDAGAALPALMMAIAQYGIVHGKRPGPALVWAASDLADRGCAHFGCVPVAG